MNKQTAFWLFFLLFLLSTPLAFAAAEPTAEFFTIPGCPYCSQAKNFLEEHNIRYVELNIQTPYGNQRVQEVYQEQEIPQHLHGSVPLIIIDDKWHVGFNEQVQKNILTQLNITTQEQPSIQTSLFLLAITLGFVDGFNVCSIGALIFILGLVLTLGSRKKIFVVGITFIIAVVIIYWFLIFLWYQFFTTLGKIIPSLSLLVGLLALGAGIYALKEFLRFKREGPTCEFVKKDSLVWRLRESIKENFDKPKSTLALLGAVFLFAAVITIIEFPCSAALPATFTGVLAEQQVPLLHYIFYASMYTLFYLLVEIIVFTIAVTSSRLWLASPQAVTWVTLLGAIVLLSLGGYYLVPFLSTVF